MKTVKNKESHRICIRYKDGSSLDIECSNEAINSLLATNKLDPAVRIAWAEHKDPKNGRWVSNL